MIAVIYAESGDGRGGAGACEAVRPRCAGVAAASGAADARGRPAKGHAEAAGPSRLWVISKRTDSLDMLEPIEHSNGLGHDCVLPSSLRTLHQMISAAQSSAIVNTSTSQPAAQRRGLASPLDPSPGLSMLDPQLTMQHRVLKRLRNPSRTTML